MLDYSPIYEAGDEILWVWAAMAVSVLGFAWWHGRRNNWW